LSSPCAHGEGDHPKGGGGVTGGDLAVARSILKFLGSYPSTMLRMVPLPIRFADREDKNRKSSCLPLAARRGPGKQPGAATLE
jgi:hypothetical protein